MVHFQVLLPIPLAGESAHAVETVVPHVQVLRPNVLDQMTPLRAVIAALGTEVPDVGLKFNVRVDVTVWKDGDIRVKV